MIRGGVPLSSSRIVIVYLTQYTEIIDLIYLDKYPRLCYIRGMKKLLKVIDNIIESHDDYYTERNFLTSKDLIYHLKLNGYVIHKVKKKKK